MALQKPEASERARELRRADTAAEQRLWNALRDRRIAGLKFVRQLPVGPYFADFACRSKKLVIEVDGALHGDEEAVAYDARRTAFLEREGYRVIRFTNDDVYKALPEVCEAIVAAVEKR
jgi:very-short-patch-repair endonuclease